MAELYGIRLEVDENADRARKVFANHAGASRQLDCFNEGAKHTPAGHIQFQPASVAAPLSHHGYLN